MLLGLIGVKCSDKSDKPTDEGPQYPLPPGPGQKDLSAWKT